MKLASRIVPIALVTTALAASSLGAQAQDYRSSVVGTDFDFIVDSDPSTFLCLESKGRGLREMPDKTGPSPLIQEAFRFVAYFDDGTRIDMGLDADFETEDAARAEAERYVHRLGKLPTALRAGVERMVIHRGSEDATAFSDVGLIALYSDNATKRISTHDLEETLFHESVHAAWDEQHADSPAWRASQASDGAFITRYAADNPDGEDLAESALFAYTLVHHPERIPAPDAARIRASIPARIAFVEALLPPDEPIFHAVGPRYECDGSGTTFTVAAERSEGASGASSECDVDITSALGLSDVLSNALLLGLEQEESRVRSFLDEAKYRHARGDELIAATMLEFGFDRATLDAEIEAFLHCNCTHGEGTDETTVPMLPAGAPTSVDEPDSGETRVLLYAIAALLLLLVIVNACTLAVLVKRAAAGAPTPRA